MSFTLKVEVALLRKVGSLNNCRNTLRHIAECSSNLARYLNGVLFDIEDGGIMFLRNVDFYMTIRRHIAEDSALQMILVRCLVSVS
jgi:hypothetical protein